MALVAFEGFDHYGTAIGDLLSRRGGGLQWNTLGGAANPAWQSPGRNGSGSCVAVGQNASFLGTLTNPLTAGYIGFGVQISNVSFPGNPYIYFYDLHGPGNVVQFALLLNQSTGGIELWKGARVSLLAFTPNNTITNDAWNFLEIYFVAGHTGTVTLRVNGQTVMTASGVDIQAAGAGVHGWVEGIEFHGPAAPTGTSLLIDDFYVCDTTTGPGVFPNNYYLGDVRVVPLHATGNYSAPGWTPGPASAHRFWRLDFLASSGPAVDVAEIQFRSSAGVSLAFSGGASSASGGNAGLAADGNAATYWEAFPEAWWQYDYGSLNSLAKLNVVEVAMTIRAGGSVVNAPTRFTLSYNDSLAGASLSQPDPSSWVQVADISPTWTMAGQSQTFAVPALSNWQEVREPRADGDGSYNSTSTVSAADRFTFEALPATVSNVLAVQVIGAYRKDDAGERVVQQVLGSGGTEVEGATFSIPQSYVYCYDLYATDPNTSDAWSIAAVNALRAGYVLAS